MKKTLMILALGLLVVPVMAGDYSKKIMGSVVDQPIRSSDVFAGDNWTFNTGVGVYHNGEISNANITGGSPKFEYAIGQLGAGYMLYSPVGPSFLRGNVELLFGFKGGGAISGPSAGIIPGPFIGFQYNFVQPDWIVVPFVSLTTAAVWWEPYKKVSALGSSFEFSSDIQVGTRIFIDKVNAISISGAYNHTSNANTSSNNHGLDGIGGWIGYSYFFN